MKYCTHCGTPVSSETRICPRCGQAIPSRSSELEPGYFQTPVETKPASIKPPRLKTIPSESSPAQQPSGVPAAPASPPKYETPPWSFPQVDMSTTVADSEPQGYGAQIYLPMQQPGYPNPALPSYPSPSLPPYAAPPQPQAYPGYTSGQSARGLSRGMTIFLVITALALMLSGLGLIYYTEVSHPAQLRAQATATVQAITQSTSVANTHATATAQVYAKATAVAQTQATAQAQATATALQAIYSSSTSGTPALSSSLAVQDRANWDVYDAVGGGGCTFSGGALHSSIFQQQFYVPCFAHATNFSNFAFQVQMTILKGDEGGLIFRANDAASQFYYFQVGRDGTYSLNISKDDKHSTSIALDNSSAIKTAAGQMNLLTVVARGNNIYLYVNKQFVGGVNDGTYASGEIGVFAGDTNNATDVAFSNARVWIL
jgi:hypothetical protein